jgi:DNA-binding transcriptional MerR regulator
MKARGTYQVKDVARISGVSIRTLHYYDQIKLLVPKTRTRAGYRLYSNNDFLRLQQADAWRVGFAVGNRQPLRGKHR